MKPGSSSGPAVRLERTPNAFGAVLRDDDNPRVCARTCGWRQVATYFFANVAASALAERGSAIRSTFARTRPRGLADPILRTGFLRVTDVTDPRSVLEAGNCESNTFAVPSPRARRKRPNRAFTLIEIMLVVAILGIVLAIGLPSIYHMLNKESMISAIRDLTDLCRNARARAVFKEEKVQLHIHVRDGSLQISGGGLVPGAEGSFTKTSAQFSDGIRIEALGVNYQDYTDADEAVVNFFPNGTSDELIIVLQGVHGEERKISLEVVTALAEVETLR